MLLNSHPVCLLPLGIFNHVILIYIVFASSFVSIGPENPYWGSGIILVLTM